MEWKYSLYLHMNYAIQDKRPPNLTDLLVLILAVATGILLYLKLKS